MKINYQLFTANRYMSYNNNKHCLFLSIFLGVAASLAVASSLDVAVQGPDVAVSPPEADAAIQESAEVDIRPEEKVLAECKELVKDGEETPGEENTKGDFSSTDALLEQIAETITSIEKAQNLRASQVYMSYQSLV